MNGLAWKTAAAYAVSKRGLVFFSFRKGEITRWPASTAFKIHESGAGTKVWLSKPCPPRPGSHTGNMWLNAAIDQKVYSLCNFLFSELLALMIERPGDVSNGNSTQLARASTATTFQQKNKTKQKTNPETLLISPRTHGSHSWVISWSVHFSLDLKKKYKSRDVAYQKKIKPWNGNGND